MAAHSFACYCGEQFAGAYAVKHISRCGQRNEKSRLRQLCTEMRSSDPHALIFELISEIQTSCNEHLSEEKIANLLEEGAKHHGRFVNRQDDLSEPSPLLPSVQRKEEGQTCDVCGIEKTGCMVLECGHITCEVHYGVLLAETKCHFQSCDHKLTNREAEKLSESLGLPKAEVAEDLLVCGLCGESKCMSEMLFLDCLHNLCRSHLQAVFEAQYMESSSVQCPMSGCQYMLSSPEIEAIVGAERLAEVDTALAVKLVRELSSVTLINCVKCGFSAALERGKIDFNYKDAKGRKVGEEAAVYMSKHRFRCPSCAATQCATCGTAPYHDAYTCESYQLASSKPKCHYCKKPLDGEQCSDADCQSRFNLQCMKTLPCGHGCFGTKNESECPSCLQCAGTEHENCLICHCEELGAAPCVQLVCGHVLHQHCLMSALERKWGGPRITFKFAKCPACNAWIEGKGQEEVTALVKTYIALHDLIQEKALKRLEFEKEDKLPRLEEPSDPYYHQPLRYAMDRFCYYQCFKCQAPYFGGKRDCQLVEDERQFDPAELVCAKCVSYAGGETDCPKHGEDYTQYKCRYCCDLAVWFCWGTTHFCEPCHNIWEQRRDSPREELPQCPGLPLCPLQVVHPANGEEFAMGCAACREELAFQPHEF